MKAAGVDECGSGLVKFHVIRGFRTDHIKAKSTVQAVIQVVMTD